MVTIRRAEAADLDAVARLFDLYRQFYEQPADAEAALRFIRTRLIEGDSHIFLAEADGAPCGFAQLYPLLSSVDMARAWLLNDLYVDEPARRRGVGRALLDHARDFAHADGAVWITLETGAGNKTAQSLYESAGWRRGSGIHYTYVFNRR
jgi:GNAT superfamily N-acetyltransferase